MSLRRFSCFWYYGQVSVYSLSRPVMQSVIDESPTTPIPHISQLNSPSDHSLLSALGSRSEAFKLSTHVITHRLTLNTTTDTVLLDQALQALVFASITKLIKETKNLGIELPLSLVMSAELELDSIPPNITSAEALLRHLAVQLDPKDQTSYEQMSESTSPTHKLPRLFALLMGINKYADKRIDDLGGPENDVDDMSTFLRSRGVPESRIRIMKGEEVTLEAMKKAIGSLETEAEIRRDDPILITFSGHGNCTAAPEGWPTGASGGKVHFLCPYDFRMEGNEDYRVGQGLLGIVLSRLLTNIANAKGNNITLIVDACHSFSVSRGPQNPIPDKPRTFELPQNYTIPVKILDECGDLEALDQARGASIAKEYEFGGSRSHVLISGCMRTESCYENILGGKRRGRFSYHLLNLLKEPGILGTLTYQELVQRLPHLGSTGAQNPQCDGFYADRLLFNTRLPDTKRRAYSISARDAKVILSAGEAQGIATGAKFAIYADRELSNKVGDMEVYVARVATSILRPIPDSPPVQITAGFAVMTHPGKKEDLKVYMPLDNRLLPIWRTVVKEAQDPSDPVEKRSIRFVDNPEDARLVLSINDRGRIEFTVNDPVIKSYGLERLPQEENIDGGRIYNILIKSADFFFHLDRRPSHSMLSDLVALECYRVDDFSVEDLHGMEPIGGNICCDGVISTVASPSSNPVTYGYRLVNKSFNDLYAVIYNFDMSTFAIEKYNTLTSARAKVEPTLPACSSALFGYGDAGQNPLMMGLTPGRETIDLCFVKVFLANKHMDFGDMVAPSPFSAGVDDTSRGCRPSPLPKIAQWDTFVTTLIIRAP